MGVFGAGKTWCVGDLNRIKRLTLGHGWGPNACMGYSYPYVSQFHLLYNFLINSFIYPFDCL